MKRFLTSMSFFCSLGFIQIGFASSGEDLWQPEAQAEVQPEAQPMAEPEMYHPVEVAAPTVVGKVARGYVGAGLGLAVIETHAFLSADGHKADHNPAGNVHVGYMFPLNDSAMPFFVSPQLQATYFGKYRPDHNESTQHYGTIDGMLILGKYLTEELNVNVKAGGALRTIGSGSSDKDKFLLGLGAGYLLSDNVEATFDYNAYESVFSSDFDTYMLGLRYYFDV